MILRKLLPFCSIILLLGACKKNQNNPNGPVNPNPDVYVCGSNDGIPVYWKNGAMNTLERNAQGGYAYSVFAADTNAFVAGEAYANGSYRACYWKNGAITFLTDSGSTGAPEGSTAYSIFVAGNDVYVGGDKYINNSGESGTLWKNGTVIELSPLSDILSVFVSGNDVYAVGGMAPAGSNAVNAAYWKNGKAAFLANVSGSAKSIFVSQGAVYTTGVEYEGATSFATFWWNGVPAIFGPAKSGASSIFVSGNDVYIAGYETINGANYAVYWKNNVAHVISTAYSNALSIFVYGNDVYAAGGETVNGEGVATVWKNGVATHIGPAGSIAYSIYVK